VTRCRAVSITSFTLSQISIRPQTFTAALALRSGPRIAIPGVRLIEPPDLSHGARLAAVRFVVAAGARSDRLVVPAGAAHGAMLVFERKAGARDDALDVAPAVHGPRRGC